MIRFKKYFLYNLSKVILLCIYYYREILLKIVKRYIKLEIIDRETRRGSMSTLQKTSIIMSYIK
jgi:hypothetical protein